MEHKSQRRTMHADVYRHSFYTDLQNCVLLGLVHFPGQTAVSDGIDDDWLVGLGTWLLEEFRPFNKQNHHPEIVL